MVNYEKGEAVSTKGSNGKTITWIATGDEQRDSAIEIQITEAVECLDWEYVLKGTNIEKMLRRTCSAAFYTISEAF